MNAHAREFEATLPITDVAFPPRAVTAEYTFTRVFTSIHPGIQLIGGALVVWMMSALWLGFSGNFTINLSLAICGVTLVMFLGVPVVLARTAKYAPPHGTLGEYLAGEVETLGGRMSGWEVLIQMLTVPACLAAGATAMAMTWLVLQ
jgi:hypothetical protein